MMMMMMMMSEYLQTCVYRCGTFIRVCFFLNPGQFGFFNISVWGPQFILLSSF